MSVTRAILNRSSARKIFGMFLFSLLSFVGAANSQPKLSFVLKDMGYENIQIDGCAVTFSRRIVPAMKPNNGFAFTKFIELNSLKEFNDAQIDDVGSKLMKQFVLAAEFDSEYSHIYQKTKEFYKLIHESEKGVSWPYKDSRSHNEFVTLLEYKMKLFIPNYQSMNRIIFFSKFGSSTHFEQYFSLAHENFELLSKFKSAVIEHSKMHSCKI